MEQRFPPGPPGGPRLSSHHPSRVQSYALRAGMMGNERPPIQRSLGLPEAAWGLRVMFRGLVSDLAWNGRRVQIPTCHWYPEGRWAVALLSALPSFRPLFTFYSPALPSFLQLTGCGPLGRWTQNCPASAQGSQQIARQSRQQLQVPVLKKKRKHGSPQPPTRGDGELQEVLWWPFGGLSSAPSRPPPSFLPEGIQAGRLGHASGAGFCISDTQGGG